MSTSKGLRLLAALLMVAGCSHIRNAREAQEKVEASGRGDKPAFGLVYLKRAPLEQLVAFAMTNRPSVVNARLAVEDARLAIKEAAPDAPLLSDSPWTTPLFTVNGAYEEATQGMALGHGFGDMNRKPSAGISVSLLVYDFGRFSARSKQLAEATVSAEMQLATIGYEVFNEVASSYFTFLEKCALFEVARTNEILYANHLARAEARQQAGEAYRLDVLRARLDLANARKAVVAASNLVDTSGAKLMNALGVDASRGTWQQVIGNPGLGMDTVKRGFARTFYKVDEAYDFARTNTPVMCVKRANLRAASFAVDYAVADAMPKITVSSGFSWTDPLWVFKWGAAAAYSLSTGLRQFVNIDRSVVSMKKAETEVVKAEQQLSVDLEVAIANRDNSVAAIESAIASVKSAKENLDTVQEQLSVGYVSRIELSDAIASHSVATGDAIVAFYDGQRAEAALFALVGKYPVYKEEIVRGGK